MTYQELYKVAFENTTKNENDTTLEHLARIILTNHYDGIYETKEAVYKALELLPEMTGTDADPTPDELSNIVFYVDNPQYVRVRRGLLKAMRAGTLFDFISKEYHYFTLEELANIIKEVDYAAEQQCITHKEYEEMMNNAADELKERLFY